MSNPDTPQHELREAVARIVTDYHCEACRFSEGSVEPVLNRIMRLIEAEVSRRTERLEREYSQRYDLGYAEGSQKGRERLLDELKVLLEGSLDRDGSADHEAITNGLRDLIITRRNEIREKK